MDRTETKAGTWTEMHRPEWMSPAAWRRYLWKVAGEPEPVRLRMAARYGCPVVPAGVLA